MGKNKNSSNVNVNSVNDADLEQERAMGALFGEAEGESLDLPWYARDCTDPLIGVVMGVKRIKLKGDEARGAPHREGLALVIRTEASCVLKVGGAHELMPAGTECGVTVGAKLAAIAQEVIMGGPRVIRLQRGESERMANGRFLARYDVRSLPIARSALADEQKREVMARFNELMACAAGGREAVLALAQGREPPMLGVGAPTIEEVPF